MKKLITIGIALLASYSTFAQASNINVISSNGLFAGNSATSYTTVTQLSNAEIALNLSDNDASTYAFGSSNNGTTSAQLDLSFQDGINNQTGDDLAFYFMGGSQEINSMRICFTNSCTPSSTTYDASFISDYAVSFGGVNYALSVITFDLSTFGFADNQALGEFSIDLIAGGTNRLASIDNLNTSPVPVPAAIWLFITGLTSLGLFSRRKK